LFKNDNLSEWVEEDRLAEQIFDLEGFLFQMASALLFEESFWLGNEREKWSEELDIKVYVTPVGRAIFSVRLNYIRLSIASSSKLGLGRRLGSSCCLRDRQQQSNYSYYFYSSYCEMEKQQASENKLVEEGATEEQGMKLCKFIINFVFVNNCSKANQLITNRLCITFNQTGFHGLWPHLKVLLAVPSAKLIYSCF